MRERVFATAQVHQGEFNLYDIDAALRWITSTVNGYHYYQDNTQNKSDITQGIQWKIATYVIGSGTIEKQFIQNHFDKKMYTRSQSIRNCHIVLPTPPPCDFSPYTTGRSRRSF